MEAAEIAKLCAQLSISDVEGPVRRVSRELRSEGFKDVEHCLIGKVLTGKRVNRDAFRKVIEQLWNPIGSVEIEAVGDNIFMFLFPNREVRSMIWARGPWHFDHSLIVMEKPMGAGDISKLSFRMVDFWVQIHNLPLMCMHRRMAKYIAEQIGTVVELPADSRECMGRFIRVKRLPEFCYACGIICHGLRDCPDDNARIEALEGEVTQYVSWLRAASLEHYKSKQTRTDTKSPSKTLSSSPPGNHSEKNSGTGRSSDNNSNNYANSQSLMNELIPVPTKDLENGKGDVEGLLQDSDLRVGSPDSI
ncbi:hypothetical protein EZV62_024164 [Acer yangbiense]|uniref:DUF4283 domain-containing protein n=1 Tax=Acer yangbiense TaxID=1000413 RepID=A0A5C7H3R7_9ROSI|nr:hypothetical protein EZV62_024164 [Acer yangbiense]